jgi:hypothetical protein
MDSSELDFDPASYTRLPPYLDSAMTLALAKQLLAASATLTAPNIKRTHLHLSRTSQRLGDGLVDTLGQDAPADKRPIDLLADHSWSAVHLRLLGWSCPRRNIPRSRKRRRCSRSCFPKACASFSWNTARSGSKPSRGSRGSSRPGSSRR